MSLWEYANPVKFLGVSTRILPFIAIGATACLGVGLVWGFFFTPDDYRQGSTVKIIYLHVPSALMAINAWFMMLVASLIWLIRRHHVSALVAKAAAPVGVAMQSPQVQASQATPAFGAKFDPMTGQPIPKFDPMTGRQNW